MTLGVDVLANVDCPAIKFGVVELVDGVRSVLLRREQHRGAPLGAALSVLRDLHKLHVPNLLEVVLSKRNGGDQKQSRVSCVNIESPPKIS